MRRPIFKAKAICFVLLGACTAAATGFEFGDDSSEYARNGQCDDPRFAGVGMAPSLLTEDIMRDATDCMRQFNLERIRWARTREEWDRAQCSTIDYGDNSSEWARDNECDDPRFTGPGTHSVLLFQDTQADARDCRVLCQNGRVWLR